MHVIAKKVLSRGMMLFGGTTREVVMVEWRCFESEDEARTFCGDKLGDEIIPYEQCVWEIGPSGQQIANPCQNRQLVKAIREVWETKCI